MWWRRGENRYTMWWMTWRAPVHYVVDDVASTGIHYYVVNDVIVIVMARV